MAELIDQDEAEMLKGLTSAQAREKWNEQLSWGPSTRKSSDEYVFDIEVPIMATYKVPVWARTEEEAIRKVERFVTHEFSYATSQIDICCGEVEDLEIG